MATRSTKIDVMKKVACTFARWMAVPCGHERELQYSFGVEHLSIFSTLDCPRMLTHDFMTVTLAGFTSSSKSTPSGL